MLRGDRSLPMSCAVLAMDLSQGVVTTRRAVIETSDSTLNMDGRLNLNDEVLNLRLTVNPRGVRRKMSNFNVHHRGEKLHQRHLPTRALRI